MADAAIAEFRHVGLADDDRTGRTQTLDGDVVLVGDEIPISGRAHGGEDTLGCDEVLDADGHAGERPHGLPRRLSAGRLPPRSRAPARASACRRHGYAVPAPPCGAAPPPSPRRRRGRAPGCGWRASPHRAGRLRCRLVSSLDGFLREVAGGPVVMAERAQERHLPCAHAPPGAGSGHRNGRRSDRD